MINSPLDFRVEEVVAGVVYPNLQSLTDGIFTQLFPDNIRTGLEAKYGDLAPVISDMDLQWLLKNNPNIPTDPRIRTHQYLQQVEEVAARQLEQDGRAFFDRHMLSEIFPNHEYIGTPLSYDDIEIGISPDDSESVVLKALGGGYGVRKLPDNPQSDTTYSIFSGILAEVVVPYGYEGDTVELPIRNICKNLARAAFQLGITSEPAIEEQLAELYTPRIHRVHDYQDQALHVERIYTTPTTETAINIKEGYQTLVRAFVDFGLRAVVDEQKTTKSVDGTDYLTKNYTTHPKHKVSDGVVTYGLDTEEPYNRKLSITLSLPREHAPNQENNKKVALAKASLLNPI